MNRLSLSNSDDLTAYSSINIFNIGNTGGGGHLASFSVNKDKISQLGIEQPFTFGYLFDCHLVVQSHLGPYIPQFNEKN